jgi:AcrR family transcriptional regulator
LARNELEKNALIYSSPAIHARRRRILEETRRMVAERGLAGFSMDEVGKRAGVAKRTLYNAFQTKEHMIAAAIHEYYVENYVARLPYTTQPGTLQRVVERMLFVMQRNRQIRNYISAVVAIYVSPDANPDIWATMHMMSVNANMQWIESLKKKRQLQPWADARQIADDFARIEYAIINDWCRGHVEDDRLATHLVTTLLTFMAGATRGAARREIETTLEQFKTWGVPVPPARALPAKINGAGARSAT